MPPTPLAELGSPAAVRKQQIYSEQRRYLQPPSAPQKENSKVHKRHSAPPLVGNALVERDGSGDEMPDPRRALDMNEADPHNVNELSLSPMNMSMPSVSAKLARSSAGLEPAEERRKRQRRGIRAVIGAAVGMVARSPVPSGRSSDENMLSPNDSPLILPAPKFDSFHDGLSPTESSPIARSRMHMPSPSRGKNSWRQSGGEDMPPGAPAPISRMNSIRDTKLLFVNKDQRSASFCMPGDQLSGFKFDDHFTWLNQLGSGSFSDVYAVRHKMRPDEHYAIKRSKREFHSRNERAEYLREVQLANSMPAHPNVVEYYRAWQDASFFYVQMELCTGGTLGQLMQREGLALSCASAEPRIWEIIRHIARGLAHIHSHAVIHCDIKPDNILISSDGVFKIGDLGQAAALKAWNEQEGDARYLSRDLLESNPSTAADIFSFGMVVYELRSGEELPGSGDRWIELRSGSVGPPADCGSELAEVIRGMMNPAREARPSAEEILQACCAVAAAVALKAAGIAL